MLPLQTKQVLLQLVKRPGYYLGLLAGLIATLMTVHAIPPTGRLHDICSGIIAFLGLYGIHAVGVWQADREPWTPEQKLQESIRRINLGQPPLQGYEYLLSQPPRPPAPTPAPLPPPPSGNPTGESK